MTSDPWNTCPTRGLLLACLRHPPSRDAIHRTSQDPNLDWNRFLWLARRHQVAPLVSRALANVSRVPGTVRTALANHRAHNARRALTLLAALGELLEDFRRVDLPVLPVKGPVLAVQLHGDPGLRQCGDLDLLVAPAQVDRAETVLQETGYRRSHPDFALSPRQRRAFLDSYNEMAYRSGSRAITVELHWRWFRNRYLLGPGVTELMQSSHTLNIGGITVPTPSPENLLLYLCAHGAQHAWYNLKWLADIPPLLARLEDPDELSRRAQQLGLDRVLAQTLHLCRDLLAIPLPPALVALMDTEPTARSLAAHARRVMLRDDRRDRDLGDKLRRWHYMLRLKTTPAYRWRETAGYLSHCEDWRTLPLPDRLFWLYYPLRPLLWLRR